MYQVALFKKKNCVIINCAFKGRVPLLYPKLATKGIAVNAAHLSITANQFCFETGCFVYDLNVLQVESFKIANIVLSLIK